ncbi:AAA family ATPase [Actinospica durhamensis]|uniref:AAA family ATPase n=1 Tax=Actinospica durhamensis TaxID=1508375 RepID=A0A941F047_9ACTN|nr:AAA family ATPase [Actinospica durhamensis]MBR7838764.1 AAA family ATPase [Actinospica durhamensis]
MGSSPALLVVSGPPGSGKTTLAHLIARQVGCPAICRDEIKEGMVHATPGFAPAEAAAVPDAAAHELNLRTLPAFFGVLELLLRAGVTTVAEAAFQDHIWRPRLEPLRGLARIRVVHCRVSAEIAHARVVRRLAGDPSRRAHGERPAADAAGHAPGHDGFVRPALGVPELEVDTTDGYAPGLDAVVRLFDGVW